MFQRFWDNLLTVRVTAENWNVLGFLEHSRDVELNNEGRVIYAE